MASRRGFAPSPSKAGWQSNRRRRFVQTGASRHSETIWRGFQAPRIIGRFAAVCCFRIVAIETNLLDCISKSWRRWRRFVTSENEREQFLLVGPLRQWRPASGTQQQASVALAIFDAV